MPNKEINRAQTETKQPVVASPSSLAAKNPGPPNKAAGGKAIQKDCAMSPTPPAAPPGDTERTELLGSLTTEQQQRTSARVIKKLRIEPPTEREKRGKRPDGQADDTECETPNKLDDKDPLKFPTTVKQRMPKALWSIEEKNLFFEALNEYGKDFDAITAYICAKMKKKGMSENLKTKTQVSHFYYRTWHKLSKHVHFDENVKKVAQELYALINYGELRKKLVSVSEKTCSRLGEMVRGGSLALRVRGRTLRLRTPMCRALRRLNQINERACGARVWSRAQVVLRARSGGAWARVQAAAHNPRAAVATPLRTRLAALLLALERRWGSGSNYKPDKILESIIDPKCPEELKDDEVCPELRHTCTDDYDREDLGDHLNLEPDRTILQEQKLSKRPVLHLGPRPEAEIHLPVVSPSEQLSSQKICFSSYLERMCKQRRDKDGRASKIRTTKRQRKDSATDKEGDTKKIKLEDESKLMHIDETAIDGIDLMASYKNIQEDEEKPSTEDEKELKTEEIGEDEVDGSRDLLEKDKYMSEREKDSFSEMEDDEKYNKSDTDNESDQGKTEKSGKEKFKNLKVKFRLRPKKRGGSIYTMVVEKEDQEQAPSKDDEPKCDVDVDTAIRQIRKGWSVYDAGDLTIGDLYLMFGSRSRLELDYWWAEPTPPLPQPLHKTKVDSNPPTTDKEKQKVEKTDKGTDSSVEDDRDRARESDNDIFSPKNTFSQDSNDGMSGDERKSSSEQLASPEHKSSLSGCSGTLKLVSKLINRPQPAQTQPNNGFSQLSDRLKRLLALAGNPLVAAGGGTATTTRCTCGLPCALHRKQKQQSFAPTSRIEEAIPSPAIFRHPTPIAPRPDKEISAPTLNLEGVPRWRRGRPRLADRRVVVQRLLPLLPKLPPPSNLIPVKIMPNSPPAPPRILPKPPPTSTSDLSLFYVLSESNGQFYFHDGDRRIPITPLQGNGDEQHADDDESSKDEDLDSKDNKSDITIVEHPLLSPKVAVKSEPEPAVITKSENSDIGHFLPSESMSLSPSRLLRDADGWLEGSVQDFSLSSFLGHLEGRPQPDLAVDSQLQSLMAESSVDYVAKFADLAAEVTDDPLNSDHLT